MKLDNRLLEKYNALKLYISKMNKVAVAFSGGVDSTLLLKITQDVLGEGVIAVTASSGSFPRREIQEAREYCSKENVKQYIFVVEEMKIDGFSKNPVNRCYLCKKKIFEQLIEIGKKMGMEYVIEGSNMDDESDYRPGMKAIEELGVKSPLRELGFTKKDIRELSEYLGLPTWNKPSFACLATRFPYGEEITSEKLEMVDRAEQYLLDNSFSQVRVRIHGKVARIEIPSGEFYRFNDETFRLDLYNHFKQLGFEYVSIDLLGYRTGSMNEVL